jgi:hypothetical protein
MAYDVTPECRYTHGKLIKRSLRTKTEQEADKDSFFAPSIVGNNINMGCGFVFEIWQCSKCSYLELHDFKSGRQG